MNLHKIPHQVILDLDVVLTYFQTVLVYLIVIHQSILLLPCLKKDQEMHALLIELIYHVLPTQDSLDHTLDDLKKYNP